MLKFSLNAPRLRARSPGKPSADSKQEEIENSERLQDGDQAMGDLIHINHRHGVGLRPAGK
jgi:hypothetical protein